LIPTTGCATNPAKRVSLSDPARRQRSVRRDQSRLRSMRRRNGGLGVFWVSGYSPPYVTISRVADDPVPEFERRLGPSVAIDGYIKRAVNRARVSVRRGPQLLSFSLGQAGAPLPIGGAHLRGSRRGAVGTLRRGTSDRRNEREHQLPVRRRRHVRRDHIGAIAGGVLSTSGRAHEPRLFRRIALPRVEPDVALAARLARDGRGAPRHRSADRQELRAAIPEVGVVQELTDLVA